MNVGDQLFYVREGEPVKFRVTKGNVVGRVYGIDSENRYVKFDRGVNGAHPIYPCLAQAWLAVADMERVAALELRLEAVQRDKAAEEADNLARLAEVGGAVNHAEPCYPSAGSA